MSDLISRKVVTGEKATYESSRQSPFRLSGSGYRLSLRERPISRWPSAEHEGRGTTCPASESSTADRSTDREREKSG
jgi:hypothetical protein